MITKTMHKKVLNQKETIIILETKNNLGEYHSENDEPSFSVVCERSNLETVTFSRKWHKNGVLHRDSGPAEDDLYGSTTWMKAGVLHNLAGPALIARVLSECEQRHEFYVDGSPQNPFVENGPIVIWGPNDSVCQTHVYKDGTRLLRWTTREAKEKFAHVYERESDVCRHEFLTEKEYTELCQRMGWTIS